MSFWCILTSVVAPVRRTVPIAIAIVMLIVGAVAGAAVTYVGTSLSSQGGSLCSSGRTITIGMLLDKTKDLSDQGVRAQFSSDQAISDINSFLNNSHCNLKFATSITDYALDNQKALTGLQSFASSGIAVVVGPLNSGAAQFILSYANTNHIVLISPSSTSPALAIANDYLFRTVPNDAAQGLADARMIYGNATNLIIVQRHDTYGDGLANATKARFIGLGGTVSAVIPYDTSVTDFTPTINTLWTDYQTANAATPGKVAIDAISFQEIGQMLIQINSQHAPLLTTTLPWYGTDGEADNTVLTNNATVAPLMAKVRMFSTLYQPNNNTRSNNFYKQYTSAHSGYTCDSYCLGAYDDVWLGALATLQVGAYDGVKIQAAMLNVAANYFGLTGPMGMDPTGDRTPTSYQIWHVGTGPAWAIAGNWDQATDAVTWVSHP